MADDDRLLAEIAHQTILCVGDLMLDHFVYGEVSRISPEAPAPIIMATREDRGIGGAGNVARNIAGIGARCIFIGVTGDDDAARELEAAFAREPRIEAHLVREKGRPTTRKVRFVSEQHSTHLLRADWEISTPVPVDCEQQLIEKIRAALPRAGAIVLSDYAKGVLTERVLRETIARARELGKPVIVDPKALDFTRYKGASLITPNRKELGEATRLPVTTADEIAAAATQLCARLDCAGVLVTRSEQGMTLVERDAEAVHVPAYAVKIRDVSGAGDTVAAMMSVWLAIGARYDPAMRAANAAAAIVVGKRGTASVTAEELRHRLLPSALLAPEDKIVFDWSRLDERLEAWRRQGLRIGFTNGCFDLLHPGHVKLLAGARAACDRLIVGLNSDTSVARLKGHGRPVQNERGRAEVLAALEAVDLVVVFNEDTPLELIARVRPSVLVKGSDYTREQVVGHEIVESHGGEVVLIDLVPGYSTTRLVDRSKSPVRTGT